jgi:hypothetical protein
LRRRIEATDLDLVVHDLPDLLLPLRPLAGQWDRLSARAVYMLILPGAIKVDLFPGDRPHAICPPWHPNAENLTAIDAHFWDWILWLGGKEVGDHRALVAAELRKLHAHLLGPLGADRRTTSLPEAVSRFLDLRRAAETRHDVMVDGQLGGQVVARLRKAQVLR